MTIASSTISGIDEALKLAKQFVLASQRPDGTWAGAVESDPRPTAFYLITVEQLGRRPDKKTEEMEAYLANQQLECGAWLAWPNGVADVEVTASCIIALNSASTEIGKQARKRGQKWLSSQPLPNADSFWKGFLALNGFLDWSDLPYLTPRLVTNPSWLRPNIYDFSFLRIAVVCASLWQAATSQQKDSTSSKHFECEGDAAFIAWKERWLAEARTPIGGLLSALCGAVRFIDCILPVQKHEKAALDWLLKHQEDDGSFFSSVHMTSIAVMTLHRMNASLYESQISAGIEAMDKWQLVDQRGRRQQFTDSTNWDTALALDLLQRFGLSVRHDQAGRALDHLLGSESSHLGDWSHRVRRPSPGGWAFQRVGKEYPDNDDTALIVTTILASGESSLSPIVQRGVNWLLDMQSSDGSWASWDRNDRAWIRIPNGGPWFARDLGSPEITARVIVILSRILCGVHKNIEVNISAVKRALRRGVRWLKNQRTGAVWYGRWFTHYLYGTCHALEAFRELGFGKDASEMRDAQRWLGSISNADGGFGEAPNSGRDGTFRSAPSTPFHTACALMTLVHASAEFHPIAMRAAAWLIANQNANGSWTNKDFFAAGVPGLWYANFSFTPTYFSAKSLLMFREALTRDRGS